MTYPIATEQFIDLIVADQELLDAEFAAIIAASWPNPRPPAGRDGSSDSKSLLRKPALHRSSVERVAGTEPAWPACRTGACPTAWYIRTR